MLTITLIVHAPRGALEIIHMQSQRVGRRSHPVEIASLTTAGGRVDRPMREGRAC